MEWIIVEFLDDLEVEVVPLKWITEDQKYCYFPSLKEKNAKQAVKDCFDIKPTWKKYKIKVKCRKSYTDFEIALKVLLQTRKSKKNTFYDYTTDKEYESSEGEAALQDIPQLSNINDCKNKIDIATSSVVILDSQAEIPQVKKTYEKNEEKKKEEKITLSTRLYDETLQTNMEKASDEQLKQNMQQYLIINSEILNKLVKDMHKCQEKLNDIDKIDNVDATVDEKIMANLPLSSLEELKTYEDTLQDAESIKKLATSLAGLTTNCKEQIWYIMSKVMTDNLASQFSYKGRNGKKNFSQLKISSAILDAIKLYDTKGTPKEKIIANWLSNAAKKSANKSAKQVTS